MLSIPTQDNPFAAVQQRQQLPPQGQRLHRRRRAQLRKQLQVRHPLPVDVRAHDHHHHHVHRHDHHHVHHVHHHHPGNLHCRGDCAAGLHRVRNCRNDSDGGDQRDVSSTLAVSTVCVPIKGPLSKPNAERKLTRMTHKN